MVGYTAHYRIESLDSEFMQAPVMEPERQNL
jgi:hypothetical protein